MTNEERIKLLDAGYTKEEIESGEQSTEQNGEQSTEQSTENQTHDSALNNAVDVKALSDAVAELTKTVKLMQDSNIKGANGGKPDTNGGINETIKNFIESI